MHESILPNATISGLLSTITLQVKYQDYFYMKEQSKFIGKRKTFILVRMGTN